MPVWIGPARGGEVRVAVAANFAVPLAEIAARFEAGTGHRVVASHGATGQIYAQIRQGAPFDVFLAADRDRPRRAEADGLAVAGSRFTYAMGKVVLYSTDPSLVTGPETLAAGRFDRLALTDPRLAPYGAAAVQVLRNLGLYDRLARRFVRGVSVAQTYQFVQTGNAALGFVAMSQIAPALRQPGGLQGSWWEVPASLYDPIAQDAVLLKHGADNVAARDFLAFLRGPATTILPDYGYDG